MTVEFERSTFPARAPRSDDEDVAVQAVHAGAQDYLVKGRVDATVLARSIQPVRGRHELEQERRLLLEREQQARADF